MKNTCFGLFFTLTSLMAVATEVDMTNILCAYWDNPNDNARLRIYFNVQDSQLIATVDRNRTLDDHTPVDNLYLSAVKVVPKEDKLMIFGKEGFYLEMNTPIAKWNKGSVKDSKLVISSYGINTEIICSHAYFYISLNSVSHANNYIIIIINI